MPGPSRREKLRLRRELTLQSEESIEEEEEKTFKLPKFTPLSSKYKKMQDKKEKDDEELKRQSKKIKKTEEEKMERNEVLKKTENDKDKVSEVLLLPTTTKVFN